MVNLHRGALRPLRAGLTMYSGFGLGTLMLPVFALFFPVEMAVVATALVHGANNVFKVSLLGRHADREVVLKFGLTAIIAACFGAMALAWLSRLAASMSVESTKRSSEVTPVKLMIGFLMIGFALFELLPRFRELEFDRKYLPLGGAVGFLWRTFGPPGRPALSVSGQIRTDQRALRGQQCRDRFPGGPDPNLRLCGPCSLLPAGISLILAAWPLVISGSLAAFAGVLTGKRYLHKVTMKSVQTLVGYLLFGVGLALILGFFERCQSSRMAEISASFPAIVDSIHASSSPRNSRSVLKFLPSNSGGIFAVPPAR